jgi:hemolysin activation/secretion protein
MRTNQFALTGLVLLAANVCAQTSSYDPKQMPTYDAGALTRQAEQMFKQSQQQRIQPQKAALPPELVINDATLVTAQRFKFNGNQLLRTEQLQSVAMPFANRPLGHNDLRQLTYAVTEAYRQANWLVQAYIPRQSLTGGELTVQVIETIPSNKPVQ